VSIATSTRIERATERIFGEEAFSLIIRMLENEQDSVVLHSAICALGHLDIANAVPAILRYQDHPDDRVRFAAAFALGHFANDPQSISGLLKLTSDTDADVRDWAVFGLGVQGNADSPEIREALLRCLDDANEDVREEAAVGLGKRRDSRLIPKLRAMLAKPELKVRVCEAATALLGLDRDPPEWDAADYEAALTKLLDAQPDQN
jgi:HEAT repeat protein